MPKQQQVRIIDSRRSAASGGSGVVLAGHTHDDRYYTDAEIAALLAALDHGALTGLSDDDHSQYALLAGRAGGQTIYGGTGASETLTLKSTSDSTAGEIVGYGSKLLFNIAPADASATALVHIVSDAGVGSFTFESTSGAVISFNQYNDSEDGPDYILRHARGVRIAPTDVVSGDQLGNLRMFGYVNGAFLESVRIRGATETVDATTFGAYLAISVRNKAGTFAERVRLTSQGNLHLHLGTMNALDSNARNVIAIRNGTAPSAGIADSALIYSADLAAGNAGLHILSETGALHKFGSYTVLPGVIRPAADSATALQLATADGTGIVIVDTTNKVVTINDSLIVNEDGTTTGDFRAESDTEANMIFLDASADTLQLGGTTNSVQIAKGGDTTFLGDGSGLPYGSCYGNEIGWTQASAAQDTWYEVSDADMADGELNGVTHDGSGKLTVAVAGRYLINYTCSAEVSLPGKHVQSGISVSGTESAAGISHYNAATANEQFNVAGTAILDLAANATIEISLRTTDTGTPDISVDHLNITVVMVGGT